MRRTALACLLTAIVVVLAVSCAADGPPVAIGDRLFGLAAPDGSFADAALADAYEKSGLTAAFLTAEWDKCEPGEPGSGKYDFTPFDKQPLANGAKTRVCWISLANPRADAIKASDPARYWSLAEKFIGELVRHANAQGVKRFAFRIEQDNPASSVGPTAANAEPLKHIYQVAKSVSKENTVIAEQPYGTGANAIQILYGIGAKGSFDVAAVSAASAAGSGVDAFQLVGAYRELVRNGDGDKRLLAIGRASADLTARQQIENDYRNILTERDIYDPAWVVGEIIRLEGKPTAELLAAFPPKIPDNKLTAEISSDGPVFSYITGKPYKLTLTLANDSLDNMKMGEYTIGLQGGVSGLTATSQGTLPTEVKHGERATAEFTVTLPDDAAGKQVTIVSTADYTADDQKHVTDCWLTLMVTPPYEVTILPPRLVLDPREGAKRVGMSVINHTDTAFEGKIGLSAYPGITVNPAEFETKIDPFGLEAFVYSVSADAKTAPGHYAVFVDVGGKAKEWQAVDVPVVVKSGPKGCLDAGYDRNSAASFAIGSTSTSADGKSTFQRAGTAWMSYTPQAFWLMVEVEDAKHTPAKAPADLARSESITVGFDVPVDGAFASGAGYRDEDHELAMGDVAQLGPVVVRTHAPQSQPAKPVTSLVKFDRANGKSVYVVGLPWSELASLKPASGTTFAMGFAIRRSDGSVIEWGGGLLGQKDPRKFVPVVLAE